MKKNNITHLVFNLKYLFSHFAFTLRQVHIEKYKSGLSRDVLIVTFVLHLKDTSKIFRRQTNKMNHSKKRLILFLFFINVAKAQQNVFQKV